MDARCIRIKKFADTKIFGYVWTGPEWVLENLTSFIYFLFDSLHQVMAAILQNKKMSADFCSPVTDLSESFEGPVERIEKGHCKIYFKRLKKGWTHF